MTRALHMPQDRYVAALRRQRDRIAAGLEFVAWDSEAVGAKDTHASWGLCSNDADAWPDAGDHLFPEQFAASGRVAPLYRGDHQPCPMQRQGGGTGCFYSCRIFKNQLGPRSRDAALALYDATIARAERG